jgi:hypothetical protein
MQLKVALSVVCTVGSADGDGRIESGADLAWDVLQAGRADAGSNAGRPQNQESAAWIKNVSLQTFSRREQLKNHTQFLGAERDRTAGLLSAIS